MPLAMVTLGVWQGATNGWLIQGERFPCRPCGSQVGKDQGPWLARAQLVREQGQVRRGDWDRRAGVGGEAEARLWFWEMLGKTGERFPVMID